MTDTIDYNKMNRQVIAKFRANGAKVGGPFVGSPLVLGGHRTGNRASVPCPVMIATGAPPRAEVAAA